MSHYTYMVTNNINGKVYVGSHSWSGEGIDPNYYGSGTAITRAVKKYGKENFQVEVLYYYETAEECRADEERILTEYNVRDCPHSYNMKNSAIGFEKGTKHTEEAKRKISESKKGENHPMYGKHLSEEYRKKISESKKGKPVPDESLKNLLQAINDKKTPVVAIDKNNKVKIFESQMECSRVLGVHQGNVNKCLKGRLKSTGGYTFKYAELP